METAVVWFNDVSDVYTYNKERLLSHWRFRVVFNDDAEKRVLWENYIPLDYKIDLI